MTHDSSGPIESPSVGTGDLRPGGGGAPSDVPAVFAYLWSSYIVFLAYLFSEDQLRQVPDKFRIFDRPSIPFNNHDGQWYKSIAESGYFNSADAPSNVAFFPFYPLCCRLVRLAVGLSADESAVLVSNVFLLGCFLLLGRYHRLKFAGGPPASYHATLAAFAVFPTTFFFRMGYTESCFVFILLAYLIAMTRGCNPVLLASIAGLLTSARSPGVAAVPATLYYLWRREPSWARFLRRSALIVPLSCWGLLAFMTYQYIEFGDPLAFVHAQSFFKGRPTPGPVKKLVSLAMFEPIWTLLVLKSSPLLASPDRVVFNLGAADPIVFLMAGALIVFGQRRRLLSPGETIVSAALLATSYISIGYESYMRSQGRYAAAIVPIYLVIGHLLARYPATVPPVLIVFSTLFFVYLCLFFSGHAVV